MSEKSKKMSNNFFQLLTFVNKVSKVRKANISEISNI